MSEFIKELLPAQDDFVFSTKKHPAIIGGLGSGKTEGGVVRLSKLLLEDRGVNGGYYMPTYDLIKLRAMPGFEQFFEEAHIPYKTNKSEYTISIENYGNIIFRSYDRPERIIAYEVGHSMVDELDTLKIDNARLVWRKVSERNRQITKVLPNSIGCVTTPDMGYNGFIYENWFKKQRDGYEVIKASTYDNHFLPSDYVQQILDNYDPILADLYLRGEIVSLNQNKVYHFYDRIKHYTNKTIKDFNELHVSIDFNVGGCVAIVFGMENNKAYAVKEFTSYDTFDFINNLTKFKDHTLYIYPDASGDNRKTNSTQTDISMIRQAGYAVFVNASNPAVRDRINSVNGLLSHDRLYINSDECPNYANAMETQGYEKGEPEKWDTHPSVDDYNDSGGYFMAYRFPVTRPMTRVAMSGH